MLTSHSVQCCSSLKSLSSRSLCWCQVEQPVLLTRVSEFGMGSMVLWK